MAEDIKARLSLGATATQQAAIDEESKSKEQQGGLLNSFFEKTSEKSAMDKQMEDYVERNMKLLKGEDPDAQEEAPKTHCTVAKEMTL